MQIINTNSPSQAGLARGAWQDSSDQSWWYIDGADDNGWYDVTGAADASNFLDEAGQSIPRYTSPVMADRYPPWASFYVFITWGDGSIRFISTYAVLWGYAVDWKDLYPNPWPISVMWAGGPHGVCDGEVLATIPWTPNVGADEQGIWETVFWSAP